MHIFHRSSFRRSNRVFSLILMFSILMTQMLYGGQIRTVQAADASSIVINEFRTRGAGGVKDEFIELYNRSENAINILNWEIKFYNSSNNQATLIHFYANIILPAGGYYLLANDNYSSLPVGDGTYSTDIPDDTGLALFDNAGTFIDAVGMKTGLDYLEGNPLTPMTVFTDQSYQRKYDALNRHISDTNNNADDFVYNSGSSNPQSSKFVNVVISQVYGGGGNTNATLKNDFIELYNHGARPINLTGWSVQYASYNSAQGTNWQVTALSGIILPGQYYLIQEAAGSNGTASLTPDVIGTINMSATAGKVALVNNTTALSDVCPLDFVVDLVGFGTGGTPAISVNCSEGSRAPAPSNTLAILRKSNGTQDTNDNWTDFATGAPTPRGLPPVVLSTTPAKDAANAAKNGSIVVKFSKPVTVTDPWYNISCVTSGDHSAATSTTDYQTYQLTPGTPFTRGETCSVTVLKDKVTLFGASDVPLFAGYTWSFTAADQPVVSSTIPADGSFNAALDTITIKFDEPVNVADDWFSLTCSKSGDHSAEVATSDQLTYTLTSAPVLASGESCAVMVVATHVTSLDTQPVNMLADYKFGFITVAKFIRDIQGAGHISIYDGQSVTNIPGVVTALRSNGFYMQDPNPDADPATSEGIFVLNNSTLSAGDSVLVSGKVSEYRPAANSLTITEITGATVTKVPGGAALPDPIILGTGGRIPPSTAIEDDSVKNVETSGVFDPANDGIDFYESLEGMLVQLNDAQAVGPAKDFTSNREIPVVGDNGANATTLTPRGGVIVTQGDLNPERIILNDMITNGPKLSTTVNVGDKFPGVTLGIMDYAYGNYKLEVTQLPSLVSGNLPQDTAAEPVNHQLSIATFNLENLAPGDPAAKYTTLANLIVNNMKSPDIMAVEEIQDNTGATDDGTVDAATTYAKLITAITTAGGPAYEYRQINPENDKDGGATGGNIRVGFLFRTDQGVSFIDRPGATSTTANEVVSGTNGPELRYSPGRIDPTNAAFNDSRKPLAGEFTFNGEKLFVIANHFNSKGGDDYLFGVNQPPTFSSEVQRKQQATIVHDFVNQIVTADPNAKVVVLGDLNDFQFSEALGILKGTPVILKDLIETLPANQQYTYVYDGNSEVLDHILASNALFDKMVEYKPVHVNAEYANQASDHDPQVLIADMNHAPEVDKGISGQSVNQDQALSFTFASDAFSDADQDALTYSAAMGDGSVLPTWLSFDATSRTFSGTPQNADVGKLKIFVKAMDPSGASVTTDFELQVINVNEPPSHTGSLTAPIATQDQPFSYTVPANFFTDADKDLLTYSASLVDGSSLPEWLSFGDGLTFSGTPGNGDVGVIHVRITATDPSKVSDYADFDITVENVNDSPLVGSPISDANTLVKQAYNFQFGPGTFIDIDKNDTLTYTASLADGSELPTWLQFDPLTRTFSGTPGFGDEGVLKIKVTATDKSGASISDGFDLTIWSYKTYMPIVGN